jgi:uncharacterized protein (DUF433 family)
MASPHLSIRLNARTLERLDRASRRAGTTRSDLAKTLIEEGLRMQAHPGIVFRPGPAGRRPALARGPDVWQVMNTFLNPGEGENAEVDYVADFLALTPDDVKIAIRYYADYKDEVDAWMRENDEIADESEASWRREQEILGDEATA